MATAKELEEAICNWYWQETGKDASYLDDAADYFLDTIEGNPVELDEIGKVVWITTEGGEGQGDQYFGVFSVGTQFFRLDGFWNSWDGVSWEGASLYEVVPKQVTITQYVAKK